MVQRIERIEIYTNRKVLAVLASIALIGSCVFAGCAVRKPRTKRPLMPTPVALTVGVPAPGGDLQDACNCKDDEIPVFVISGRALEMPTRKKRRRSPDPFGTDRSLKPNLGVAYVTIGEKLSNEELREQAYTDAKKKKAKVRFKRIELTPESEMDPPWKIKDQVVRHNGNPWVQKLSAQLDRSPHRTVYIYVHGYNTDFIENTLTAAEMYFYLGREGAVVSFEWPSEQRLLGYVADKSNASYSTRNFRALISNLAKECNVDSITILAHSAGGPIVVGALRELRLLEFDLSAEEVQEKYRVNRVVLAAPDMDLQEFVNAVFDRFHELAKSVAVYASKKDRALLASEILSGNDRLGNSVGSLDDWEKVALGNVSTLNMVDASQAEQLFGNFIGHNYYHDDPWVSSDIGSFILGKSPQQRGLVRPADSVFWKFPPDYPEVLRRLYDQASQRSQPIASTEQACCHCVFRYA